MSTLVLGIGNSLLSDDGVGVHVVQALQHMQQSGEIAGNIALRDGGTIGLSLLSEFADYPALIAVDAAELGAPPGTVRTFLGVEMDRQLGGTKRSAHEVALSDLIGAAHLSGTAHDKRALIAIQPASTEWGLEPTEAVKAAIPLACEAALSIIRTWSDA
ncbi:MAG: HyaD/HybD family hydrogenase maturation endopeptidase [Hyphomicrobiaceae bacterium]|nr:HyaD/HybD family hydrogenase maturation endopeptidase [Hyphomicrobiaceae bacterium]